MTEDFIRVRKDTVIPLFSYRRPNFASIDLTTFSAVLIIGDVVEKGEKPSCGITVFQDPFVLVSAHEEFDLKQYFPLHIPELDVYRKK